MPGIKDVLIDFSIRRYRLILVAIILITLTAGIFVPRMTIDSDQENLLRKTEPVRVFHNQAKQRFDLSDTIVLGVINEQNPDGVFNPATLQRVYELTEFAKTLRWEDPSQPGKTSGVIEAEMLAPSMVDHMSQAGPGTIRFEWLMPEPPKTSAECRAIRDKALSNPLLKGRMVSEDGKALCIYLPLTDKLLSYRVYEELNRKIKQLGGDEAYHIAGLPIADAAVGVEMFKEMTVAAPLTMLAIFGLLFVFFRKGVLIVLPMIIATVTVVVTMGLMIALGYPVHILSSMIPIFLMPIAICDSIHILSDFFEVYTPAKGRGQSVREVMQELFVPIFYTSVTTAAGFLSFLTTTIPPARVFGFFVALGVMIAWLTTVLLTPAYIMLIPERMLADFGKSVVSARRRQWSETILQGLGRLTYTRAKSVLAVMLVLVAIGLVGITRINVNDNYAKRFSQNHPIRKADVAINSHFGGTYTAHLILEGVASGRPTPADLQRIEASFNEFAQNLNEDRQIAVRLAAEINAQLPGLAGKAASLEAFLNSAIGLVDQKSSTASDAEFYALLELKSFFANQKEGLKPFKQPQVLEYMLGLQRYLERSGIVGQTTSAADVVCKVNQELTDARPESFRIPSKLQGVAECYMQFQQSHRPNDLWHMLTPDYNQANIWIQFTQGDSMQTEKAVKAVDAYIRTHQPPVGLTYGWAGLHYVNLVFQRIMVRQMLTSFAGTFVIVFIMMIINFRSWRWALASMLPLSITIALIYGITGLIGKDYDMPVAVMSAISLGMAIDFAIHFLERCRQKYKETGTWADTVPRMFGEPALAISRNSIVLALGFLPLLLAQLTPYKTIAVMIFGILTISCLITLVLLPALITVAQGWFFKAPSSGKRSAKRPALSEQ